MKRAGTWVALGVALLCGTGLVAGPVLARPALAERPATKEVARKPAAHSLAADTVEDDDDDASPQLEAVHVVKAGETLGGVANRAHVARVLIIEANGLKEPYSLREGQRLRLPRTRHHTVAKGETGFDIAYHYGVPFSAIATANGLDPDADVEPGQKLLIPTITANAPGTKANSAGTKMTARLASGGVQPAKRAAEVAGAADAPTPAPAPAARAGKVDADAQFVWPASGQVLRRFVSRGTPNYHDGIDIAGTVGAPVRASAGGEVIFAGQEPESFGRLVLIDHKNGWQTAYGFLGKIAVAQGDHVRTGERIGLIGHSGKAKRDELHFELRRANRPVDPMPELPAVTSRALAARGAAE